MSVVLSMFSYVYHNTFSSKISTKPYKIELIFGMPFDNDKLYLEFGN